jgi:uncharacterized protein (TIGR04255 family)
VAVANFKWPPVGEVSFGLWFAPLAAFKTVHYGAFWDLIRQDYPECDDKPQVFEPPTSPVGNPEWFPFPRVWYLHRSRNYLIQLQPNRIWLNWRRLNDMDEYPRFETLIPIFRDVVKQFADFAAANNIGDLVATGGELSYVNQIPVGEIWADYSEVGNFMEDVRWVAGRNTLPKPSGIAWRADFELGTDRLNVNLKSGKELLGAQRPLYMLEIRAANSVGSEFEPDPFSWFERANRLIVESFCELTTRRAQREFWKRTD